MPRSRETLLSSLLVFVPDSSIMAVVSSSLSRLRWFFAVICQPVPVRVGSVSEAAYLPLRVEAPDMRLVLLHDGFAGVFDEKLRVNERDDQITLRQHLLRLEPANLQRAERLEEADRRHAPPARVEP